jgi:hypothetical protein
MPLQRSQTNLDMNLHELTDDEFARYLALIYRVAGIRIA